MKKLLIILLLTACAESVEPRVAQVIQIESDGLQCKYKLGGVVPYALQDTVLMAECGKWGVGEIIYY